MARIKRAAQAKNENEVKDFLFSAGSPVIAQTIHKNVEIPWHTASNILERFEKAELVKKIGVPWGTGSAFIPTPMLQGIDDFKEYEWERVGEGFKLKKRETNA